MSNVYDFVAKKTGYKNLNVTNIPLLNITVTIPGPLNANFFVPFVAPDLDAQGAGGRGVFVSPLLNKGMTAASAPPPVNLTALNMTVPSSGPDPTVVKPSLGDIDDGHGRHSNGGQHGQHRH